MDKLRLSVILEKHTKWLHNKEGGERANLSAANLSEAYLYRANLSGADLSGAYMYKANLSGADLSEADLSEANLYKANLSGAYLYKAALSEANLCKANLSKANLHKANLSGATLYRAALSGATLCKANLSRADLSGANLSFTNVKVFILGGDAAYYHEGLLKIRCQEHILEFWLSHYEQIGRKAGYNKDLINVYGNMIKDLYTDLIEEFTNEIG